MSKTEQQQWEAYVHEELETLRPFLTEHGYTLDTEQPHTQGERFLMQAITTSSGKKIILLATTTSGERVVIKATSDRQGARELTHERTCRNALKSIAFAYEPFYTPKEIFFGSNQGQTISIQEFIPQESTFLARSVEEQFFLALKGFKIQESAHATTFEHSLVAERTFGLRTARDYLRTYKEFFTNITQHAPVPPSLESNLLQGQTLLEKNECVVEQYSGFLTHTDFVPHNIRIQNQNIYLLDHSSLLFGNKYEGWARFLNFMELYNPKLKGYLLAYVEKNRTPEESVSLRLMRTYRLAEIIWYYTLAKSRSEGNLEKLNDARIIFWSAVLSSVLSNSALPNSVRYAYIETRDALRSDDEKLRQKNLH